MVHEYIQATIGYEFTNVGLLSLALQAAHRDGGEEGASDDGNRGLAKIGLCVMDFMETHNTIVKDKGTRSEFRNMTVCKWLSLTGDANKRQHWFRTKKARASACSVLGLAECIVQSSWQKDQQPSLTVLDNALSAIVGAVWRDLEDRNESVSNARVKICSILSRIDTLIQRATDSAPISAAAVNNAVPGWENDGRSTLPGERLWVSSLEGDYLYHINQPDSCVFQWPYQSQLLPSEELQLFPIPWEDATAALHGTMDNEISTEMALFDQIGQENNLLGATNTFDTQQASLGTADNGKTRTLAKKRKFDRDGARNSLQDSVYSRLIREEVAKLDAEDSKELLVSPELVEINANPPQMAQLRLLYLYMGSSKSLMEFRGQLQSARARPYDVAQSIEYEMTSSERFMEICRIDDHERLCVLSRRFHLVKLFGQEMEELRNNATMVSHTPATFIMGQKAQAGNPLVLQEAAVTDQLLCRLKPDCRKGTKEFEHLRRKVSRLRRLSKLLRLLTDAYGLGVLALLPCGPNYSEVSVTDNMSVSSMAHLNALLKLIRLLGFTEQTFTAFADLLRRKQGLLLRQLSSAIEPALTAFMNGSLTSMDLFPIERIKSDIIEGSPKGSLAVIESLKGTFGSGSRIMWSLEGAPRTSEIEF